VRKPVAVLIAAAIAISGCDATPAPTPSPPPAPTPSALPTTAPSPAPAALPIVVGMLAPQFFPSPFIWMSNWSGRAPGFRLELPIQLVYDGLYRYDASFEPVPDLAADPCDIADDGLTIRCRLVTTTFHDGTPMTADDVVFSYELAKRQKDCEFAFLTCVAEMLESVTAPDPSTVEFRLTRPNATFLTLALPEVMIESRSVVEGAYAPLAERAATLDPADYDAAAKRLTQTIQAEDPDCPAALAGVDELFAAAGLEPPPENLFPQADGTFNSCGYVETAALLLDRLARSLEATGLDAIALAYPLLSSNRAPIGTGPFRFAGLEDGSRATFEAFDGYHFGKPATPRIEIRATGDASALASRMREGEFDWVTIANRRPELVAEADAHRPGTKLAKFPDAGYYMLVYNLRPGRLFADPNLRAAMELCIDKSETVKVASGGQGQAIYSAVDPISWAFQPDLVQPKHDPEAGRRLIEASGWTLGNDGIYERKGHRLATDVFVLGAEAPRVKFLDIVAAQVRECGIELHVIPEDQKTVLGPVLAYPHIAKGHKEPFDAVFYGWLHGLDPDEAMWHSKSISSSQQPQGTNVMGFSDPRVDELLDRGLTTYDQRERARIYRQFQDVIAEDHPVMFGWAANTSEVLDERLTMTDGEPDFGSRMWPWKLEKLILPDR
jgi:ABC-type transport system substrate-binding protein